jgi:hypothetical protein
VKRWACRLWGLRDDDMIDDAYTLDFAPSGAMRLRRQNVKQHDGRGRMGKGWAFGSVRRAIGLLDLGATFLQGRSVQRE